MAIGRRFDHSTESPRIVGAHRALAALRATCLAAQDNPRHYVLGDEFLRLAFAHSEARPDHVRVEPVLQALTERFGETTHYAVLDGVDVVYRAKVDPQVGGVRLTSTVGGRNAAHATGVGKALLAVALPDDAAVHAWVGHRTLGTRTAATLTTPAALAADLAVVRERGWATDDEENELGIVCVAIPVYLGSPMVPSGAISISALRFRTSLEALTAGIPEILQNLAAARIGKDL